jgi:N-methylhydantoinase A/oxoprolinase/acetone carboxylase beta subunit
VAVRVGVDVGGTFTKAVACDPASGEVVARAVVSTTHTSELGVADGVRAAIEQVADDVRAGGLGPIELVTHSTTQAVNALLEGDTARVGVLGIGRRPHLRRSRKRTSVGEIRLAPGHRLETVHEFLDGTAGVSRADLKAALERLVERGAEAICISEVFGVEDSRVERDALDLAGRMGLPACAGHELTGLYGLELRTVTGAVNAGILPPALVAAEVVEEAVRRVADGAPLLVMRGDGGSAGMDAMRSHPLLTAFSGPAASVCGALRHLAVRDGVVVEVGGTSTNVTVVKAGRPALAYVRVLEHVTSVRSLDVRVAGVAGGSLARIARRGRKWRVAEVGPRSAHIAGLEYSCFATPAQLAGAELRLISPRAGDPAEYAVLETAAGAQFALTLTCAANALGEVPAGSYSAADPGSARAAFAAAAPALGMDWRELAQSMLDAGAAAIARLVADAVADHELSGARLIGVGGGAGALVPAVGGRLGLEWATPPDGEVISSVGDALSLIRVEVERTASNGSTGQVVAELHREAEEAAIRAGAAPATVRTESETVAERSAVRVIAHGSVALESGKLPSDAEVGEEALAGAAAALMGRQTRMVSRSRFYSVYVAPNGGSAERFAVIDSRGSTATTGEGLVLTGSAAEVSAALSEQLPGLTRNVGPFSVAPGVRILRGARLVDLTVVSKPAEALEAALAECRHANGDPVVALISSS